MAAQSCVYSRDMRYTGTGKVPVYIIFQMVRYHNFAQFGISYAAVAKFYFIFILFYLTFI